jgi:transposase
MDKVKVFIGIDVSKDWLDFAAFTPGGGLPYSARCANSPSGAAKVLKEIRKAFRVPTEEMLFCMEHTGIYCAPFLEFSGRLGLKVWQENAMKIRKTQQLRGKSDVMDARRIAEYAFRYKDKCRLWVPEPESISRLRNLLALRERLMKAAAMLAVPKGEAGALGRKDAVKDMERFSDPAVRELKAQAKRVEAQVDELIAAQPEFQENYDLVCSVAGVGRMTALTLILFTRNFSLFDDPRKLACYCGVAPFEHSSGSSIRGRTRVSHFANKDLKKIIHMAAISAIRHNPDMKAYFIRKVEEGKNKMSVINAVRSKLLHCIMAVINRRTPWLPKFSKAEENFANAS